MFGLLTFAMLLKNKLKKQEQFLPSFRNILEVKHHIKGRLRLKVNTLHYNDVAVAHLEKNLKKLKDIKEITIDKRSASILLQYDEDALEPIIIISAILKVLNLESQLEKPQSSSLLENLGAFKETLNHTIHEQTQGLLNLDSLLVVIFLTTGLYRLRKRPRILPNAPTLLWWSYQLISKHNKNKNNHK